MTGEGSLLLEQDGVRRRIPPAAVAEVRAAESPRGVEVVLTAPEGTPPTVYRVAHRGTSERDVFVTTVNASLPARNAEEPRRDGSEPVVAVPGARGPSGPVQAGVRGCEPGARPRAPGRGLDRRRGISVLASFHRHDGKKRMFRFTDLDGVQRDCEVDTAAEPVATSPERFQVSYDPRHPARVAARLPVRTWVLRSLGVGVFGTLMLYAGLYMVPYQLIQVLP